jgi:hypothetical protein
LDDVICRQRSGTASGVVFGKPEAGTPLMQAPPTPQRKLSNTKP